jgi:hypothetical protein
MRPKAWVVILFVCVIMLLCRVRFSAESSARAEPKKTLRAVNIRQSAPPAATVRDSWEVFGVAHTDDDAKKLALDEAREKIGEYLAKQDPPIEWRPDVEYLRRNEMVNFSESEPAEFGLEKDLRKVTATVKVTSTTFQDMQDQDRKFRSRDRQTFLGKILAVIVAGLAAVAVYLRLDEATKGYYSLWLRLGSAALVASVAAGVWMFR